MMRFKGLLVLTASLLALPALARAQDIAPGAGTTQVTIIPGGATFFTEGKNQSGPNFGNYTLGASVTYNFTNWVAVEGEVGGALGITQDLTLGGLTNNTKTPNTVNYTGNVVFSLPTHSAFVPYATAGIGGLTLLDKPALGIDGSTSFLTGNVGGGLKWYAGRWGLRADYRFLGVKSKDDAPTFFGQENRYGHRVYGGLILNVK
jgi:outer membrane protein with beta-barrel domain